VVGHLLLSALLLLQQAPQVTVGIRPAAIRVGDRAVLSVRVIARDGFPEAVDFVPPVGVVVEEVVDRSSSGVGAHASWVLERTFHLRGDRPGEYALPPISVSLDGVVFSQPSPGLTVAASPLSWPEAGGSARGGAGARSREADPLVPQGRPPAAGEMQEATPQAQGGYPSWGYPGYVPGYSSQLPGQGPGGLWAYPGSWYSPYPYGPNGGWPIAPPGATPGLGGNWQGGFSPFAYGPGQSALPGVSGMSGMPGMPGQGQGLGHGHLPSPAPSGQGGLQGGQTGTYTLPPIPGGRWPEGMGGGWAETAASDPWWPEVVPELFQFASAAGAPGGDASLSVGVTPARIFVGQQATLVATASFRPGAFLGQGASPEYLPPNPPDFWVVDLPDPPVPLPTASQGGVDQGYTFRRALFPMRSGEFLIPPASLLLPAGSRGGDAWDTLSTDPLPLTVLPIPRTQDLPGFKGAVGRYRMEAGVTPTRLAVGEAALLVVRILGAGNIRDIPAPEVGPVFGAELSPGGDGAVVEVRDGVVGGVRTFTWLMVPTEPGPLRIDPVVFTYFDPYVGNFGQVASQELLLDVTEFPENFREDLSPPW